MKVAIIGAGACGLACGMYLRQNTNYEVVFFERNKSAGRKILASGNGKCNVSNNNLANKYYNTDYFKYDKFAFKELMNSLGLVTIFDEEGRVYPLSNSSKTILDFLLYYNLGNKFNYETEIKKIEMQNGKYLVNNDVFDYIVLASGSWANIVLNKQKGVYEYLKSLDISLTKLKPSLVGFVLEEDVRLLSGLRFKARVSLLNDNQLVHQELGEIIFKDQGISGIVVMNMSFYYNHCQKIQNPCLELELYPTISAEDFAKWKLEENGLKFIIPDKLQAYLTKTKTNLKKLVFKIVKTYDFADCQVVSGGIIESQMNQDFSLKDKKHLYAGGELLNVDGLCGGYNLNFAFNSGIQIAKNIIKENEV